MTCKYEFKGRQFLTEEELNDFLLATESLKSKFGDEVYQLSTPQNNYRNVLENIQHEYSDLRKQGIQLKSLEETEEVEPEDLDDVGRLKFPYISVTDLIHTMPGRNTEQAFPIFRSDEYWKEKFLNYKAGIFDKYELLFIGDLLTKDSSGNYERISDENLLNKIRDRIEGVLKNKLRKGGLWKQQAVCGNLVHEVFSKFYRDTIPYKGSDGKVKKGKYLYLLKDSPLDILNYLMRNLGPEYKEYITEDNLKSIIALCIQLDEEIRDKYGKNAFIRTEQPIVGDLLFQIDKNNKITKIIGKIDLLVVAEDGRVGIVDFKCSPKDYTTNNVTNDPMYYNSAKILTFKYQLAAYRRILELLGVSSRNIDLYVVPLKFEDFKLENGKVSFSRISSLGDDKKGGTMLQKLSNSDPGNESSNIESVLDLVFGSRNTYTTKPLEVENVIKTTKDVMDQWCPVKLKNTTLEGYKETIESRGGIKFDSQTNKWYYKPDKFSDSGMIEVEASSKETATVKIVEELRKRDLYNLHYSENTARSIRKSLNEYYNGSNKENPIELIQRGYISQSSSSKRNHHYIRSILEKYTNTDIWKPVPGSETDLLNRILDLFGLLLFENKNTGLIDIVRISSLYNPKLKVKLSKGSYILGSYLPDNLAHNTSDSLTMVSTAGNIELIETMVVMNQIALMFENKGIGKVKLLCPSLLTGLEVSNEQLLYNFTRLCNLDKSIILNNYKTSTNSEGIIKMATYVDIVKQDFEEIKSKGTEYGLNNLDRDLKVSVSKFDWKGKTGEEIKDQLLELDEKLIREYPEVTLNIKEKIDDSSPLFRLHRDILYAISELSGVKMLQLLEEQKKFEMNFSGDKIGMGGTMIDNPGTLLSPILNQATNLVTIAYQNTRDAVVKFDSELRERVKKLKQSKGFNWISLNLTGNLVSQLYYNMYDHKSSDVKFVNPWDENVNLLPEERDFLKYALIKINCTRHLGLQLETFMKNPDLMGKLIESDTEGKYLIAPLVKGDFASEVAIRGGIIKFIRNRFLYLSIWNKETRKKIKERIDDKVTNLLSTEKLLDLIKKGEQWTAVNVMSDLDDPKNSERRQKKVKRRGKEYFEHNLETLLLKQHSAYTMQEELNKIFPIIQSLLIHLNAQGAVLNEEFTNDMQYLLDYIRTKVHNQPMEDRTTLEATLRDIAGAMMKWASRFALAFNPRQAYQFLDGIWQDIKLFIKLPDGSMAFTKENLTWSWKFVMRDLFGKFGDDRSITELLNIKYGINDMDMNTYIDRIKSDNTGMFTHFWDTGFRFSSRPDYYNRMTIFIAQMRADGSFDAHSIKDGKLVYDWKKDERFKAFAENSSNKEEYNKAKTNYITLARQLMEEGAKNDDGTLFKLDLIHPQDLPKAYSNKESEGRKAFSDRIYGYYAHEKKSMFNSTFVGALTMQMNTYWSAKKNLYILQRSYTQEGYYTDYVEDGVPYYWKVNEETGELEPTDTNTGVPIKVWKGRPQEGIAITLVNLARAFKGKYDGLEECGFKGVKELLTNEKIDPDLRRLYNANLRQILFDLFMLILLGVFASTMLQSGYKLYAKDHPNDKLGNALTNTAMSLGIGIIDSSADDFNFMKSIFGRGVQWTPFSISSAQNVVNLYKNVINGNQDFYDAIVKTTAAGRGTTPIWDFVKLNTVGEKVGEKK